MILGILFFAAFCVGMVAIIKYDSEDEFDFDRDDEEA